MQIAALWDPLPDSSPCTPTRWCPVGRGPSGGPGSIPGLFWRTGVPSIRRYSAEPLHSGSVKYRCRLAIALTIALLGPWPWAPEKKKKKLRSICSVDNRKPKQPRRQRLYSDVSLPSSLWLFKLLLHWLICNCLHGGLVSCVFLRWKLKSVFMNIMSAKRLYF